MNILKLDNKNRKYYYILEVKLKKIISDSNFTEHILKMNHYINIYINKYFKLLNTKNNIYVDDIDELHTYVMK